MAVDNISSYGVDYQRKVIISLIEDTKFIARIHEILSSDFFEKETSKWIIDVILDYYREYRIPPTLDVFKIKSNDISDDITKSLVIEELKQCYLKKSSTDLDMIMDTFIDFCKNQTMKEAILKSADLLKSGNYAKIKLLVEEAFKAGVDRDIGHDWKLGINERLLESSRLAISTGWDIIDDLMDGGIAAGELGVLIAPPGAGKSFNLAMLGLAALKNGKTVVHYTLELDDKYVGKRYDTCLIGIPPQKLKDHKDDLKLEIDKLPGELIIKYYPTKLASCDTFRIHLEHLRNVGTIPDLIVIDYGDLVKSIGKSSGDAYQDLGSIFTEMRSLAGELQIPIWTATQSKRSSVNLDIIQSDSVAESFAKIMIADFIWSLSRKPTDKLSNTGRYHIIKNRFGPDGLTFPAKIDYVKGVSEIYSPDSQNGINSVKDEQNGKSLEQKVLKSKYDELMG